MVRLSYRLLAAAALVAVLGSAPPAGAITINDATYDSFEPQTITAYGGAGLLAEYLDFSAFGSSAAASGEIFIQITSFGGNSGQDQVNNEWQLYATITNLSVTGSTSGSGSGESFASTPVTGVTGTLDLYAVSGDTCKPTVTDSSLDLSSCPDTTVLASGALASASTLSIANLGLANSSETFNLIAALTVTPSGSTVLAPANFDLIIDSGNGLTAFSDFLHDAPGSPAPNWCSGDGSCEPTQDRINWSAVPEPASLTLFGTALAGLAGLGAVRRRKRAVDPP